MVLMVKMARLASSWSMAETKTWPSSWTSILQLQLAQISWMTLPPLPMTSLILSVGITMLNILGAQRLSSRRGSAITGLMISSRIYRRPLRHFSKASAMMS